MIRSMRGVAVDMSKLITENSHKIAIGNANLNARGDKVNSRGAVLATHEQIMTEYNSANPRAVKQVGLSNIQQEAMSPAEAVAHIRSNREAAVMTKRKMSDTE
jgi:hypothetical protein